MPTAQYAISATSVSSKIVDADQHRRYLMIQNYYASTESIYVAFGQAATPGNNGELEIVAGAHYEIPGFPLKSPLPVLQGQPNVAFPNCPSESINVITATGSATGSIMVITP